MSFVLDPVRPDTLRQAVETAVRVFDEFDRPAVEPEFAASASGGIMPDGARISRVAYFLALKDGAVAGVTGWYTIRGHEEDVWLGWLGLLPGFKGQRLGGALVRDTLARAAATPGARHVRIWTVRDAGYDVARGIYRKMGFTEEPYRSPGRPGASDGAARITVFSKALAGEGGDGFLWRHAAYEIDPEDYEIPRLNALERNVSG